MSRTTARLRAGNERASLYTEITDKIIAELPHSLGAAMGTAAIKASLAMPRNASTQRGYSGINVLILWALSSSRAFPDRAGSPSARRSLAAAM